MRERSGAGGGGEETEEEDEERVRMTGRKGRMWLQCSVDSGKTLRRARKSKQVVKIKAVVALMLNSCSFYYKYKPPR